MAERNVGVRLQVLDGGKVKAELASVGEVGAAALGSLEQKSQQAAAAVNKLRTHEVTNLSAQLTDLGVQVLSGQSFATAMIQQGPQIAAVLGERGVKASLMGVGSALASLVTPTTAILAGIVALGYGASYVFDAIADDTDDASEALKRHADIIKRINERYGEVTASAKDFTEGQKQVDIADARANAKAMRDIYMETVNEFAKELSSTSVRGLGEVLSNASYKPFSGPIKEFLADLRAGSPDVDDFRGKVAALINATDDPAIRKAGEEILEYSRAASDSAGNSEEAARGVDVLTTSLNGAWMSLKDLKAAMNEWGGNEKLIQNLARQAETADDPRQRAIDNEIGRLTNPTPDQITRGTAEAGAKYDAEQLVKQQEKSTREAASSQRRLNSEMENAAQQIYDETRTAGEAYADTLDRISGLLKRGLIDQATYDRAVGQAAKVMKDANREALEDATDAASGYQRAITDYVDAANDMARATENLVVDSLSGMEDALVGFVTTGKMDFSSLVDSMIADLARLAIRQSLAGIFGGSGAGGGGLLSTFLGGFLGGGGSTSPYMAPGYVNSNSFGGPRAGGGAVQAGVDYLTGEDGVEIFRAPSDGYIVPNSVLKQSQGTMFAPVFRTTIDARGADQAAVARLERGLADSNKALARNVQGIVRQTQLRGTRG